MKPNRENVFQVLARVEQAGSLPNSGQISVFVCDTDGALRRHPTQLVVRVSGDTVFVRFTRMPFVRPYVYSRQALHALKC